MPERENVAGGVHVPVVYGTALIADRVDRSGCAFLRTKHQGACVAL